MQKNLNYEILNTSMLEAHHDELLTCIQNNILNVFYTKIDLFTKAGLIEIFDVISKEFSIKSNLYSSSYITKGLVSVSDNSNYIGLIKIDYHRDGIESLKGSSEYKKITFSIAGSVELIEKLDKFLRNLSIFKEKHSSIEWYYKSNNGFDCEDISLGEQQEIYNEFYPWIEEGIDSYLNRYLSSKAMAMIFLGPPGTGKTSLIRHLIWKNEYSTIVTYEESLMESDHFFVNFLTSETHDLLVVEDADVLLTSREATGNKIMSKFLNVTDGLIQFPKKKIIFTANLTEDRDIDKALMRPGRCFDVNIFRNLTAKEANEVAKKMNLDRTFEHSVSLGELFNYGNGVVKNKPKVGFI